MAHFCTTWFRKTTHKMTFRLGHGMRRSNLKLAKHERTDLSRRNIAIWEAIKHEIMEISIWTCSFPKPSFFFSFIFFAFWGYEASCQHGDAQVFGMQKNPTTTCLFFCSINSFPIGIPNINSAAENERDCLLFLLLICNHIKSTSKKG